MWPFSPETRSWNFATGRSKPRAKHGPAMVCLANQKRQALTQPFHKRHLRFDAASAVVSTPSLTRQALPKDAAQSDRQSARPRYFSVRSALLFAGHVRVLAVPVAGLFTPSRSHAGLTRSIPHGFVLRSRV